MALLRALGDGTLRQFFASWQQQQRYAADPAATLSLDFDESTNAALVLDIQANMPAYTLALVNGSAQVQKNGAAVTIAPASALYSLQSAILNGVSDATLKAAIVALWNGTATAAQQQRAVAFCLLRLNQAGLI